MGPITATLYQRFIRESQSTLRAAKQATLSYMPGKTAEAWFKDLQHIHDAYQHLHGWPPQALLDCSRAVINALHRDHVMTVILGPDVDICWLKT